jgi:hypothetical protein
LNQFTSKMKINIAYPTTGNQKFIVIDEEAKL